MDRTAPVPSAHPARRRAVETICTTFIALEAELDALDAKIGDGDTGSTFASAARAIAADLDRLPLADPAALCASISERLSTVMGGSSGILRSIGMAAMGASLSASESGDDAAWTLALRQGLRRIQQYGGASEGDRTMLDALLPAVIALQKGEGLAAAATAAKRGADSTAAMTSARAGRASYVPESALRGVPDPGAVAMAAVLAALAR
jgi:dihydroxyacetone kinase